jgi:hypothetical protein
MKTMGFAKANQERKRFAFALVFAPVIIHLAVNKLLKNLSRLKKPYTKAQSHSVTKNRNISQRTKRTEK